MKITNTRIEKQRAEINKTKAKIAELNAKLREQDKQLRALEDLEIVAQFRNERLDDEHLGKLRSPKPLLHADTEVSSKSMKEDTHDAKIEN